MQTQRYKGSRKLVESSMRAVGQRLGLAESLRNRAASWDRLERLRALAGIPRVSAASRAHRSQEGLG